MPTSPTSRRRPTPRVQIVSVLIGFCMGGMYTLKAARSERFARLVAFYGMIRVPEDWRSPSQGEPLDHLATATRSACWRSSVSVTRTRRR